MELLINRGANIDGIGHLGQAPLHWAAMNGRASIAKFLLENGADPLLQTDKGYTPIHLVSKNNHPGTLEIFLDAGVDVLEKDFDGNCCFHHAALGRSKSCLATLIHYFDEPILPLDYSGESPLDKAAKENYVDIIELFLENFPDELHRFFPNLIKTIVNNTCDERETDNLKSCVISLMETNIEYADIMIHYFVSTCIENGSKLLVHDEELYRGLFIRGIKGLLNIIVYVKNEMFDENPIMMAIYDIIVVQCKNFDTLWIMLRERFESLNKGYINEQETNIILSKLEPLIEGFAEISKSLEGLSKETDSEFFQFIDKYCNFIRELISQDINRLLGPFDFILENSRRSNWDFRDLVQQLTFEQKLNWFKKKIREDSDRLATNGINITVNRGVSQSFMSSCTEILTESPAHLKSQMWVKFEGEEGVGAGVIREWFHMITREMFDVNNALFRLTVNGNCYYPNSSSEINSDHLSYFEFVGRFIGMAIYHGHFLDVHFASPFIKQILGITPDIDDLEQMDILLYQNLSWINDNNINDADLELTFSTIDKSFGTTKSIPLIEGGEDILVTEENKSEFLEMYVQFMFAKGIQQQVHHFLRGFHSIIPEDWIGVFNIFEMQLVISGMPTVDIQDWKQNTIYNGFDETNDVILWFWEWVDTLTIDEIAQLLLFVTGSSRVPLGGFSELPGMDGPTRFTITLIPGVELCLPKSSTCLNILKLPLFESREILIKYCSMAIKQSTGFGYT
eukprot:TRINITY_DN5622_c0_g1_i2.p1 TRINITY_DN5622_c0_g1~~TRINITY_DN5622_c0_g1_i2.p1  ORF type:complete len:738 (+),score=157.21 TRINITY_DN5622_c0_g1_i2:447-2660(+)